METVEYRDMSTLRLGRYFGHFWRKTLAFLWKITVTVNIDKSITFVSGSALQYNNQFFVFIHPQLPDNGTHGKLVGRLRCCLWILRKSVDLKMYETIFILFTVSEWPYSTLDRWTHTKILVLSLLFYVLPFFGYGSELENPFSWSFGSFFTYG